MRVSMHNVSVGDIVVSSCGAYESQVGIVIDSTFRREHQYLDRDLWLLILFGDKLHWQISYDCCMFDQVYNVGER